MFPFSPRDSPPSVHNLSSLSSAPPHPLPLLHPPCNLKWVSHGAVVRPCFSCHCRHFLCWRMKHFYFWSGVWALHPRQFRLIYGLLNFLSENWLQRCLASFFLPPFSLSIRGAGWLVGVATLWLKHFRVVGVDVFLLLANPSDSQRLFLHYICRCRVEPTRWLHCSESTLSA